MPAMRKNRCLDQGAGDEGRTNFQLVAFAHGQDLVQRDFLPDVSRYLFYLEFFTDSNTILLAAGFYVRGRGFSLRVNAGGGAGGAWLRVRCEEGSPDLPS